MLLRPAIDVTETVTQRRTSTHRTLPARRAPTPSSKCALAAVRRFKPVHNRMALSHPYLLVAGTGPSWRLPILSGTSEGVPKVNSESKMLIDGELVDADSGKTFQNINPATEEVLGEVADGSAVDMGRAVGAARRAFDSTDWSTNRKFRQRCLVQLQVALESEREEFREELIAEVGCPRAITYGPQLDGPLESALRYPAKLIDDYQWETDLGEAMGPTGSLCTRRIWREPVGVVGAIVPWNFPLEVTLNKLGQALATGNTVVLKPAPDTPFNATRLGRLVVEMTDIPPGVLNVVTSSRPSRRRGVDPLARCGPDLVHRLNGRRQADHGKGRRNDEAPLPRARRQIGDDRPGRRRFAGRGPLRSGHLLPRRTRLRHPDPHAAPPQPLRRGSGHAQGAVRNGSCGRPTRYEHGYRPGYLSHTARSRGRVHREGHRGGGDVGRRWTRSSTGPRQGMVRTPDAVRRCRQLDDHRGGRDLGPVLSVIPFDDDDDAIRIANDSTYGLAGYVCSTSVARSVAVARRIHAGVMGINDAAASGPDVPFGGYKHSGVGRQNGLDGFDQYLEVKAVAIPSPYG